MGSKSDFVTPLAKVRGLGSAKAGVSHYIHQRITAIFLIPLIIWLSSLVIKIFSGNYDQVLSTLSSPLNSIGLALFFIAGIYHGMLGMKVIIEDYVHCECMKNFLLISIYGISFISIFLGVLSVLAIHFKYFLLV